MTITSTHERPVPPETEGPPEAAVVAIPVRSDDPAPQRSATPRPWSWVDAEEPDVPRASTGWLTRFAWAKTTGGW